MTHLEYLKLLGACDAGQAYAAEHRTLKSAWNVCVIPDWLTWLVIQAAYSRRFRGEIEASELADIRSRANEVYYRPCDVIRACLDCPEVPE